LETITLTEEDDRYFDLNDDDDQIVFGLGGDDLISPTELDATVYGGAGNDTVHGNTLSETGEQLFYGGEGDDELDYSGHGRATLRGGDGDDFFSSGFSAPISGDSLVDISGGAGDDALNMTVGSSLKASGGAGSDTLIFGHITGRLVIDASGVDLQFHTDDGGLGQITGFENYSIYTGEANNSDDLVRFGSGNDFFESEGGRDRVFGGAGRDGFFLYDEVYLDTIFGGAGNDHGFASILARPAPVGDFAPVLAGGAGHDRLELFVSGNDVSVTGGRIGGRWIMTAGEGFIDPNIRGFEDVRMTFHTDNATIVGSVGDDQFSVWGGNARISAGSGDDVVLLQPGGGTYFLRGGPGEDRLVINRSEDAAILMDGRPGHGALKLGSAVAGSLSGFETFTIQGSSGADVIWTGGGNDRILASRDDAGDGDFLGGSGGQDTITGGAASDTLLGGTGDDALFGGAGDDRIVGGTGRDYLTGGQGADIFVFTGLADSGQQIGQREIDAIGVFEIVTGSNAFIDRIDLSVIDAQAGAAGNQAFQFIGTAAFTAEGQVRVQQAGAATFVEINVAGASGPEMKIWLAGITATQLHGEDFIL